MCELANNSCDTSKTTDGSMPKKWPMKLVLFVVVGGYLWLSWLHWARNGQLVSIAKDCMRGIGTCVHLYAEDYEGGYPPNLETLLDSGAISPQDLRMRHWGDDSRQVTDFHYVTGLSETVPVEWILAYGQIEDSSISLFGDWDGILVLYAGGYVRMLDSGEFEAAFNRFATEYEAVHGEKPTIIPPH